MYILWCGFALCLVGGKGLAAKSRPVGIKCYAKILWLLLVNDFLKGIDEADDGTCVQAFGVDARVLYKGVIRALNERVSVEKE